MANGGEVGESPICVEVVIGTGLRETIATRNYVHQVQRECGIDDPELAQRVADFVVSEVERWGAKSAVLYFDEQGCGPLCSWCGMLGGLCKHIRSSAPVATA